MAIQSKMLHYPSTTYHDGISEQVFAGAYNLDL